MAELKEFEGKAVTEVGVEIRNVAGGLQDAVKFTPVEWEQGSEHFIVLRCLVKEIDHEPVDKEDFAGDQRRVHVLIAAEAFPIAASYVEEAVEEKRAEIKKLKDEADGTPSLDLDLDGDGSGDDLPLGEADAEGEVKGLVERARDAVADASGDKELASA